MRAERRKFLRTPLKIPVELQLPKDRIPIHSQTGDLSEGGLHFYFVRELVPGTVLQVKLHVAGRLFRLTGEIVYSFRDEITGLFRTGLKFKEPASAFRAKIAEEILRIQKFREELSRKTGAAVSEEEAAQEWVKRYSKAFSEIHS